MNPTWHKTLSGALGALLLALPAHADTIKLKNGAVLVGTVAQADSQGLTFRRADNGGVLELSWDHLAPDSVEAIKKKSGLIVPNDEEVLVPALQVKYLAPDNSVQVFIGERVGVEGDRLVMKSQARKLPIPTASIQSTSNVSVPALDLYTREEFYTLKLAELAPGEDARKHMELGLLLSRVRDYGRALEHLQKALDLGVPEQADAVQRMKQEVELKQRFGKQAEDLARIDQLRNRGEFQKAAEAADKFDTDYPDSQFKGELAQKRERLKKAREEALARKVAGLWYGLMRDFSASKARERDATIEAVRVWCEQGLGKQIRERIARLLQIQVAEVDTFWRARTDKSRGETVNSEIATYGTGSWILSDKDLMAKTEQGKEEAKAAAAKGPQDEEAKLREAFRKRIEEAARRARAAAQGGPGAKDNQGLLTEDQWWTEADQNERQNWIMAYYAEKSGDMEVMAGYLQVCVNCGASGKITEQDGMSGNIRTRPCPLCHGKKWIRRVRFR